MSQSQAPLLPRPIQNGGRGLIPSLLPLHMGCFRLSSVSCEAQITLRIGPELNVRMQRNLHPEFTHAAPLVQGTAEA